MTEEENTLRGKEEVSRPMMEREELTMESLSQDFRDTRRENRLAQSSLQGDAIAAKGMQGGGGAVVCRHCGAQNEAESLYCGTCGKPLHQELCPNCGSEIDEDADFCEVCHHYIKRDVCSFCGAAMEGSEQFCPECGMPRGGVVCPNCHTLNDFAFCKQCGIPLTEEAKTLMAELKKQPEYENLQTEVRSLMDLQRQLPYTSERDLVRDRMNEDLRERVLKLLAQDEGVTNFTITKIEHKRMSTEELKDKKEAVLGRISDLLNKLSIKPQPSPAKARNYAMAQKPVGVRLAWVCNYKHAMHSSPCGCGKPQLGGKWVVLGGKGDKEFRV